MFNKFYTKEGARLPQNRIKSNNIVKYSAVKLIGIFEVLNFFY